jgi:hypothetical protein
VLPADPALERFIQRLVDRLAKPSFFQTIDDRIDALLAEVDRKERLSHKAELLATARATADPKYTAEAAGIALHARARSSQRIACS